jgi:hypothetical protein
LNAFQESKLVSDDMVCDNFCEHHSRFWRARRWGRIVLWRVSKQSTHARVWGTVDLRASTQALDTNMHTLAPAPPLRIPRLAQS